MQRRQLRKLLIFRNCFRIFSTLVFDTRSTIDVSYRKLETILFSGHLLAEKTRSSLQRFFCKALEGPIPQHNVPSFFLFSSIGLKARFAIPMARHGTGRSLFEKSRVNEFIGETERPKGPYDGA
uniref:Uncharacterized protein n=1 Tax=Vespula pensylvanica TaxID=30213 RepID=A0A834K847_VESPE|nr:hypothetical protein H0235_015199 [Vespula pensylvanica]